jgi:hypothetical protein
MRNEKNSSESPLPEKSVGVPKNQLHCTESGEATELGEAELGAKAEAVTVAMAEAVAELSPLLNTGVSSTSR